ncbi:hypothetical protein K474DRAFT_188162 [Panus rudis PR-1116 ss-1]|nr:hypothetical protein K474DRAFT_188162 [Panus rudis PR-1116 ss-1]
MASTCQGHVGLIGSTVLLSMWLTKGGICWNALYAKAAGVTVFLPSRNELCEQRSKDRVFRAEEENEEPDALMW